MEPNVHNGVLIEISDMCLSFRYILSGISLVFSLSLNIFGSCNGYRRCLESDGYGSNSKPDERDFAIIFPRFLPLNVPIILLNSHC